MSFLTTLMILFIVMSNTRTPELLAQAKNLPRHLMLVMGPSPSKRTVDFSRERKTFSWRVILSSPVTNFLPEPDL